MPLADIQKMDYFFRIMAKTENHPKPFRIGIFPIPGFALLSYASTVEPLRAANLLAGRTLYDVVHFAAGSSQSSGALAVPADHAVGDMPALDLLLVIAGGDPIRFRDAKADRWLARVARAGVMLGGVSGGPAVLANAGLMADRRMTVHWEHARELNEAHPDLLIERRLYVFDRDRITCGGGTAPMDMMHALIADQHGADFARQVSDWFLHTEIRAPAAPQRAGLAERLGVASPHLIDAISAMEDHVSDPLTLTQIALVAGVSPRQLTRLFEAQFSESPMAYYRRLRLSEAKKLLATSGLAVTQVALAAGFSSVAHFSDAFTSVYGTSPSAFRKSHLESGIRT